MHLSNLKNFRHDSESGGGSDESLSEAETRVRLQSHLWTFLGSKAVEGVNVAFQ